MQWDDEELYGVRLRIIETRAKLEPSTLIMLSCPSVPEDKTKIYPKLIPRAIFQSAKECIWRDSRCALHTRAKTPAPKHLPRLVTPHSLTRPHSKRTCVGSRRTRNNTRTPNESSTLPTGQERWRKRVAHSDRSQCLRVVALQNARMKLAHRRFCMVSLASAAGRRHQSKRPHINKTLLLLRRRH